MPVDPQGESYDWATRALPAESYSLTLESYDGDQLIGTDPVDHYARIDEARSQGGSVVLLLDSGAQVDASAISAIRNPSS